MRFAVWDTETTGLPFHQRVSLRKQPRTIEFAGVITDGETILDEVEFICNPGIVIEEIITKITGLKNEDLIKHQSFLDQRQKVRDFFSKADANIAHNLPFDKFMLTCDLARGKLGLEEVNFPSLDICTVEESAPLFGHRMRLQHLYEHYCGPYVQKHRALDDVRLLHEVCKRMGVYRAYQAMEAA